MVSVNFVTLQRRVVTQNRPKLLHLDDRIVGDRSATDSVAASSPDEQNAANEGGDGANEKERPHADERQIELDTDRSFVLYPVGEPTPFLPNVPSSLCSCRRVNS